MYRPTVRYDDVYNDYVEKLFKATDLDRNQIMRLGLFLLGHTEEGTTILEEHLKDDSPLPSPAWYATDHGLWMEQTWKRVKNVGTSVVSESKDVSAPGGEDVNAKQGQQRQVYKSSAGAIKLFIK